MLLHVQFEIYIYKGISLHSGVMTFQLGVKGGDCRFSAAPCSPLFWIKNVATAPSLQEARVCWFDLFT